MGNSSTKSLQNDKEIPLIINEVFSIDDYLKAFANNYVLYLKQNDNYDNTFTEFYYKRIINRALYRIYQDERLNKFDTNLLKYLQAYDLYNEIGQNKDVVELLKEEEEYVNLDTNGTLYKDKGLPEKRFLQEVLEPKRLNELEMMLVLIILKLNLNMKIIVNIKNYLESNL